MNLEYINGFETYKSYLQHPFDLFFTLSKTFEQTGQ